MKHLQRVSLSLDVISPFQCVFPPHLTLVSHHLLPLRFHQSASRLLNAVPFISDVPFGLIRMRCESL